MKTSFSGNGYALADDYGLHSVVELGAQRQPDRAVLSRKVNTEWVDVSYSQFAAHVRSTAVEFLNHGVQHGDRIAILGRTCYEWVVAGYAALAIGAVTVPVYPTASGAQIQHVLTDSGAQWFLAETPDDAKRMHDCGAGQVWLFSELTGWYESTPAATVDGRLGNVRADDLAIIVYTSGTTGLPKGCVLTHRNMYASSANTVLQTGWLFHQAAEHSDRPAATLLALPLAHVFGQTILLSCLIGGTRTGLLPSVPELPAEMGTFQPTFLALVPYALEKIRKRVRPLIGEDAQRVAVEYGMSTYTGNPVSSDLLSAYAEFDKTRYEQARAMFGGRFHHVISGGASLDDTTAAFYAGLGVTILNCYGLTEAATAVTVNEPRTNRMGTVGRPIPGTTVAVADDSEVLVRGANVSPGYWPAASEPSTAWLHTGDLGELDSDGFLRITGRRKEILVTSGGKNVTPTVLEDRIRLHPLVSNCMVVGDGRPFVTALITVDLDAVTSWAGLHGHDWDEAGRSDDDRLIAEVQQAVDEANELVSRAESVRAFRIVQGDFTVDSGELTPSLKLRRSTIEQHYSDDISYLYQVSSE